MSPLSIICTGGRTGVEKLCDREKELAFCKEYPRSAGQRNSVQHYRNSYAEREETVQLSHLCDGKDERSWSFSRKGSHAGTSPLVRQSAG